MKSDFELIEDVNQVRLPTASVFVYDRTAMSTRNESFNGPTPVVDALRGAGEVALWGPGNNFPQRVAEDKRRASIIAGVCGRKTRMLTSGGIRYGTVHTDQRTGFEVMRSMQVPEIHNWLRRTNANRYVQEGTKDWFTYANIFPELVMGKGRNYVAELFAHDAGDVRLGIMDNNARIDRAYVTDWAGGKGASDATVIAALEPYYGVEEEIIARQEFRYILPLRDLNDGQKYYGLAEWNGLRANGWLDVSMRVPELKKQLLNNLMHLSFHIEIDERYWPIAFPDWHDLSPEMKLAKMRETTKTINDWLKGEKGQGGSWMSTILQGELSKTQDSLVKITDKRSSVLSGAYVEDSQEADFIIVRDSDLPPPLYGISPSKSGTSAGSGAVDRVLRTNWILDHKGDADTILSPLAHISEINGWNKKYGVDGQPLSWWFGNYYAVTQDRTMQVGDMNQPGQLS